jgi:hypothetical protein
MIDANAGMIRFDGPSFSIAPSLTRTEFLASAPGREAEIFTQNEPWCSWKLKAPIRAKIDWIVVVWFHGERLTRLSLSHMSPDDGSSWADWSMEKERKRQKVQDEWLLQMIPDSRREFPWGKIWSGYDDRSAGSSIEITFKS